MQARYASLMIALLLPAFAFAAQVYEWKDASGKMHYSDRPPPGVDAKPTGMTTGKRSAPSSAPSAPLSVAPKSSQPPETPEQAQEREAQEEQSRQRAEVEQERAKTCESATRQLKMLESGQRAQTIGPNGEPVVLDDSGRRQAIQRAREVVMKTCQVPN